MSQADHAQALTDLLEHLRGRFGSPAGPAPESPADPRAGELGDPLVDELVRAMLQWEASASQASAAYQRVLDAVEDYNELRICFPSEFEGILGPRYPRVGERAVRLRAILNDIFGREHGLTLEHLRDLPKREASAYAASLDGVTPFAASRLVLLGLGGHAFPVDARLLALLERAGAVEQGLDAAGATGKLERALRAGEAREAYELLEAWDADGGKGGPAVKAPRKAASKATSKRGTKKKAKKKVARKGDG